MKKMMLCMFALTLALSLSAFAQDNMGNMNSDKSADQAAASSDKGKLMTLRGWVSDEKCGAKDVNNAECAKKCVDGGSAIVFVNQKDKKVWSVKNPDTLKDHVGHHVKLSAHVYKDGSIHVMSVSMLGSKHEKKAAS